VVGVPAIVGWLRVGVLQRRLDGLRQPAIPLASYSLRGPYRGPEGPDLATGPEIQLPKGEGAFLLRIPALAGVKPSSTYRAYVADPQGRTVWTSGDLEVEGAARGLRIFCQSQFFRPGRHTLHIDEVRSTDGQILQTFPFPFRVVSASE
jgi:hypothetical protein